MTKKQERERHSLARITRMARLTYARRGRKKRTKGKDIFGTDFTDGTVKGPPAPSEIIRVIREIRAKRNY
jgi:hypothetical protein